jgi:sterol desaturase/sphingolipid hydroxylase (fatty acid hydroxylase superfamily)
MLFIFTILYGIINLQMFAKIPNFLRIDTHGNNIIPSKTYNNIYFWAFPIMVLASITEIYFSRKKYGLHLFNRDYKANIVLGLVITISAFVAKNWQWFVYHLLWKAGVNKNSFDWLNWVLCFICCDLVYYWYHRMSHEVNILWASHQTHHSSTEFNLSLAARINGLLMLYRFIFWAPLCAIGFHPIMIIACNSFSDVYQFFTHTKHFGKNRILDFIFVTPSNHRSHHGYNEIYINKNYGGFFIIWDRIFGTYQAEKEAVKFGLKNHAQTYSVNQLIFGYWNKLFAKLKKGNNISQLLFGQPNSTDKVVSNELAKKQNI